MPVLPSYKNQSIDLICANQQTGFYMRATRALNGLTEVTFSLTMTNLLDLKSTGGFMMIKDIKIEYTN